MKIFLTCIVVFDILREFTNFELINGFVEKMHLNKWQVLSNPATLNIKKAL